MTNTCTILLSSPESRQESVSNMYDSILDRASFISPLYNVNLREACFSSQRIANLRRHVENYNLDFLSNSKALMLFEVLAQIFLLLIFYIIYLHKPLFFIIFFFFGYGELDFAFFDSSCSLYCEENYGGLLSNIIDGKSKNSDCITIE